jgi:hypothetical protein
MKLADLNPALSPVGGVYQSLTFDCPRCRKHNVLIDIWGGRAGDHVVPSNGFPPSQPAPMLQKRLWHAEQDEHRGWGSLTITPSIDRTGIDKCGGWHGFITNGEVT